MAFIIQINWCNYGGYKVIDVNEKLHDKVQAFMLEYFRNNELFKVLKVHEQPGIEKDFLKLIKHILLNDCSIMVVEEATNAIKGVALLKWMTQDWHSWMDWKLLIECQHLLEICDMVLRCFERIQAKDPNNDSAKDSLHIFSYHLCKELQDNEEFLRHFFDSICEVARHMHMPKVTFMCLHSKDCKILENYGFQEVNRIIYSLFVYKGRRPFDRLRDVNEMYGCLYEKCVPAIQPFQDMIVRHNKSTDLNKEGQKKAKD